MRSCSEWFATSCRRSVDPWPHSHTAPTNQRGLGVGQEQAPSVNRCKHAGNAAFSAACRLARLWYLVARLVEAAEWASLASDLVHARSCRTDWWSFQTIVAGPGVVAWDLA